MMTVMEVCKWGGVGYSRASANLKVWVLHQQKIQ